MQKMKDKKRAIGTIIILVMLITIWGLSVYLIDPFYHYHKPWFDLKPIATKQEYQIMGMAKYFDYNNVVIGSSMTENFKTSWFDEKYEGKTIKLSFQLGKMENYNQILEAVFSTHKVNHIFFGLDPSAISKNPQQTPLHYIPEYITNDNLWDDVNYLFNKDIMLNYLLPYVKKNITNQVPDFDEAWNWENKFIFSKEQVIENYKKVRLKENKVSNVSKEQAIEYANINMNVIIKYIEENPNTNFYIFYPPYSVIAYDEGIKKGEFENCMLTMKYSAEKLLKYDNVELYLFQNMQHVITNIDLYKDIAHYNGQVNRMMFEYFGKEDYKITNENCDKVFDEMNEFLENYDYNALLED